MTNDEREIVDRLIWITEEALRCWASCQNDVNDISDKYTTDFVAEVQGIKQQLSAK